MYQCIKQFGSIKTGSFWDVDRYIVNSDGERRRVIITNEEKSLLLSMTEFENHFAQANKPLTEEPITNDEWKKICSAKEFAEFISSILDYGFGIDYAPVNPMGENVNTMGDIEEWLKQLHIPKDG